MPQNDLRKRLVQQLPIATHRLRDILLEEAIDKRRERRERDVEEGNYPLVVHCLFGGGGNKHKAECAQRDVVMYLTGEAREEGEID